MGIQETSFTPVDIPDGLIEAHGNTYMSDGTGGLRAVETIPPVKKLMDELVRKEFGFAMALSDQLRRFRTHLIGNLDSFDALVMQEYEVRIGGKKGNRTYSSFDGLWKIEIRIQDYIAYGPELLAAKALFDDCLNEWSASTRAEMRSIVTNAFNTDKAGQINRANIHTLLKTESEDDRWQRGQDAIRDAVYVLGSKEYVRFSYRSDQRQDFKTVSINLANA
ncbi:DUF3164 family protein [Pseudorhodobacter sp.]|uniref:DUF3164 family protein n=1 Tax=Pseudorhodobacter sp. TaxID=1934400 RepID=UPI002648053A|nr:DUF3164 family protein [Pseudorhodobacter sp.]MDN5785723.1 DUF3164 family protein [Pseudorhodobacter sp.]